jgi:hypothetical protein
MTLLLFLLLLISPPPLFSQPTSGSAGAAASSERIYQFLSTTAQFIKWNDDRDHAEIVVTVLNDDNLSKVLTARTRPGKSQKRSFLYKSFDFERLDGVHIVYAGTMDRETRLKLEMAAEQHRFVLITSDSFPFDGPHIRLLLDNARVRWEINEEVFTNMGIELNPALKRMAVRPALVSTR